MAGTISRRLHCALAVALAVAAVVGLDSASVPVAFNTEGRLGRGVAPKVTPSLLVPVYQGLSLVRERKIGTELMEPVMLLQEEMEKLKMEGLEEPVWLGSPTSGTLKELQEKYVGNSEDGSLIASAEFGDKRSWWIFTIAARKGLLLIQVYTVLYCTSFLGPYRVLKASPNTQELTFHRTDHQLISIYLWFSWIHLETSYFCSTIRTWKSWGFWMLDLSTLPEAPSSTTLGLPGARWAKLRDRNAAPSVCDLLEDDHAALLAVAAGLSNWHRSVRFCAKCGGNQGCESVILHYIHGQ